MVDNATRKELAAMALNINNAEAQLIKMKAEYDALRLEALRTVAYTIVGEAIILESGARVIKIKKNRHGRYKVTEGKTTLVPEYMGGLHDLRFEIAMGNI